MRALRIAAAICVAAALLSLSLAVVSAQRDGDQQDDHQDTVWVAILRGASETPPREPPARGVALFHPNDGSVDYIIIVTRISNVFAAHIHCGAPGVAGPVGVTLFMGTPASGPVQGVLVRSSFSAPDPGNACGWTTVAGVAGAAANGTPYGNVNTNDGGAPPRTRTRYLSGGEMRGDLVVARGR